MGSCLAAFGGKSQGTELLICNLPLFVRVIIFDHPRHNRLDLMLWSYRDAIWEINFPNKGSAFPIFFNIDLARNVGDKPRLRTKRTELITKNRIKTSDCIKREGSIVFVDFGPKMYRFISTIAQFAELEHDCR